MGSLLSLENPNVMNSRSLRRNKGMPRRYQNGLKDMIYSKENGVDGAFPKPEVYEYLEPRDIGYAIRLPTNEVLQEYIKHLPKQPTG